MAKSKIQQLLAERDRDSSQRSPKKISPLLEYISIFFLIFGIFVRLIQYVSNRSLWDDEAALAINIVNRSYLELLSPLERNQAAPPGFLWIEKLSIQLFGNNEYALRLFPFIASIVSLFAFYQFTRRYISALAAPIAIALFACLSYNLYYATEVKQYGSDVMLALLFFLILIPLRQQILKARQILLLSLVGAIGIWLSHPSIFVLSGIELSSLLTAPAQKKLSIILNRLPVYLVWLSIFGVLYFLTISGAMQNEALQGSWGASYPDSLFELVWLFDAFGRLFYTPLGFVSITDGVAMFAFVCGCVAYYRINRTNLLFITSPFLTTLLGSYLHKYPFRDRLILFLIPFAIAIIAEGVVFLLAQFQGRRKYFAILGVIVAIALLAPPALQASQLVIRPALKEEIKGAIEYVKSRQQPEDSFYIYTRAQNAFTYYAEKYGYFKGDYVIGVRVLPNDGKGTQEEWKQYKREIERFRGKRRVWLLYRANDRERQEITSYLNQIGQQIDYFSQPGIFVYLYDFSRSSLQSSKTGIFVYLCDFSRSPWQSGKSNDANFNQ
ncbi:MAG: glycosyltransferase family 39 protein [Hydrococcus sp. C42_A2020_068]|nr:glycosyltransferase family 39 protein [Hydrococcus sp. C42_A2020_068]